MKKKFLGTAILASMCIFSLASCGNEPTHSDKDFTIPTTEPSATGTETGPPTNNNLVNDDAYELADEIDVEAMREKYKVDFNSLTNPYTLPTISIEDDYKKTAEKMNALFLQIKDSFPDNSELLAKISQIESKANSVKERIAELEEQMASGLDENSETYKQFRDEWEREQEYFKYVKEKVFDFIDMVRGKEENGEDVLPEGEETPSGEESDPESTTD